MHDSTLWIGVCHGRLRAGSGKDLAEYGQSVEEMTKILRDGRRERAKRFYIASDFNIELGFAVYRRRRERGALRYVWAAMSARMRC